METELERFCDWAEKAKKKHLLHPAVQTRMRELLAKEFPDSAFVTEVSAIKGGRNDLMGYHQDGRRAVFELFCSPSQVPQDLRLLEQAEAHWKLAILLDKELNADLYETFFRKKPDGYPFLWLSQIMMPSKEAECRNKLRTFITKGPFHSDEKRPAIAQTAYAPGGTVAQTAKGDIYIDQKKILRPIIAREPGDISEATAHEIQDLIRELAKIKELAGKDPSYGGWQQRLKNVFKVESYRKLTVKQGEQAIKWLKQQIGRAQPSLRRTNNPEWRNRIYSGIWAAARELGWDHQRVHDYANEYLELKTPITSLTKLGEQNLKALRTKLGSLARNGR